ncbi:Na+-transporting methylmalonyl-CoA/oxaloacetate decarboxylase gamma subunit [Enterococcus sp. PF1-24]|uniref:hypothetical protein n=1 Tax=unclassified Enterococcus TaxID=2608891 RepID=UPI002474ED25|nr:MULTISPECIES: hypothetical protein [unclassified Enterococcus]MDH6365526.1 Na+-transporting methylmalonyl-CoA/oxaloacetate decarboxylase gamma subunit [Enterococcus sp. PFB1-1]MDH6402627.1 Na+-transporting methylmalonyl-CoA/oxaloacetate decarboxylase gamma subunit [Enterococcus sp. PF1-24]
MKATRRFGLLLSILFLGCLLGILGMQVVILVLAPLFLVWFINWDESRYFQREQTLYQFSQETEATDDFVFFDTYDEYQYYQEHYYH